MVAEWENLRRLVRARYERWRQKGSMALIVDVRRLIESRQKSEKED